jgi:hypothetical protein
LATFSTKTVTAGGFVKPFHIDMDALYASVERRGNPSEVCPSLLRSAGNRKCRREPSNEPASGNQCDERELQYVGWCQGEQAEGQAAIGGTQARNQGGMGEA